ncbi:MAG TPA: hypothetical protein VKT52_09290 [Ktedonobacterales bacterium]|nr:hypothetical protein [Ktedonobacterales bacterium]
MTPLAAYRLLTDPDLHLAVAQYRRTVALTEALLLQNGAQPELLVLAWRDRQIAADILAGQLVALLATAGL